MKKQTPENGTHIEYYDFLGNLNPRGDTKYESNYKNGLLNGKYNIYEGYWEIDKYHGSTTYECNYLNGVKDGPEISWSKHPHYKSSEKYYKEGQLHGKEVHFEGVYVNQQLDVQTKYVCNYKNGIKDGKCTSWHTRGQKESEGYFINGEKEGEWTYWFPNGVIKDLPVKEWEDSNESEEAFPGSDDDFNKYIENRDSGEARGPEFSWYEDDINAPYWPLDE